MVSETEARPALSPLEQNRLAAISNLERTMQSEEENRLREHQLSMFASFRDSLRAGNHAGYMDVTTGAGKTPMAVKLAESLGLKTLILAPTVKYPFS